MLAAVAVATSLKYSRRSFVVSVLPAPLSPLITA